MGLRKEGLLPWFGVKYIPKLGLIFLQWSFDNFPPTILSQTLTFKKIYFFLNGAVSENQEGVNPPGEDIFQVMGWHCWFLIYRDWDSWKSFLFARNFLVACSPLDSKLRTKSVIFRLGIVSTLWDISLTVCLIQNNNKTKINMRLPSI
jgi:hypothetical protein